MLIVCVRSFTIFFNGIPLTLIDIYNIYYKYILTVMEIAVDAGVSLTMVSRVKGEITGRIKVKHGLSGRHIIELCPFNLLICTKAPENK